MLGTMKVVLQRVTSGQVEVMDEETGERDPSFDPQHIGIGYVALVGVSDEDGDAEISWMAHKISHLRVFGDDHDAMNRSILDVHGSVLSISQFTLFADTHKGNRPSFIHAGKPEHAKAIWLRLDDALRAEGITVNEGRFASHMAVSLVNDGPVTICLDSRDMPAH